MTPDAPVPATAPPVERRPGLVQRPHVLTPSRIDSQGRVWEIVELGDVLIQRIEQKDVAYEREIIPTGRDPLTGPWRRGDTLELA